MSYRTSRLKVPGDLVREFPVCVYWCLKFGSLCAVWLGVGVVKIGRLHFLRKGSGLCPREDICSASLDVTP